MFEQLKSYILMRIIIRSLGVLVAILLVSINVTAQESNTKVATSAQESRPNIVLFNVDNMGYGDLGCYGGGETRGMPTPNIDKLASEGIRLTQFLVTPSCAPTRAALLTGRYPIRSMTSDRAMQTSEITLAELLKQKGYATAAYGKWHLGLKQGQQPQQQGFDEFYGVESAAGHTLYQKTMKKYGIKPDSSVMFNIYEVNDEKLSVVGSYNVETRKDVDEQLTTRAISFIKKQVKQDNPFFIYIPWTRVHYPNYPSDKFKGKSRIGNYGDSMMEMDDNTGQVLKALADAGIEDNTIVIFMSDNGPMRSMVWPDGGFQGPFRGDIGSALEGSIRTAGIIKWPGHFEPGVAYGMFSCMDFYPTLANILNISVPSDRPIDGINQLDYLKGYKQKEVKPARTSLISFINGEVAAIRWKQFRIYQFNFLPQQGFKSIEGSSSMMVPNISPIIYNIEEDPRESVDIAIYNGWLTPILKKIYKEYEISVKEYPNPKVKNF